MCVFSVCNTHILILLGIKIQEQLVVYFLKCLLLKCSCNLNIFETCKSGTAGNIHHSYVTVNSLFEVVTLIVCTNAAYVEFLI